MFLERSNELRIDFRNIVNALGCGIIDKFGKIATVCGKRVIRYVGL